MSVYYSQTATSRGKQLMVRCETSQNRYRLLCMIRQSYVVIHGPNLQQLSTNSDVC